MSEGTSGEFFISEFHQKFNLITISDCSSVCPSVRASHFHFFQFLQLYQKMSLIKFASHVHVSKLTSLSVPSSFVRKYT